MKIRKITGVSPDDRAAVEQAFAEIEPQPVACCNWPAEFPYAPEVSFRMFHTGDRLMLRFDVAESYTAALVIMCIIREFLGSGTFGAGVISADGVRILPEAYPALMMILPGGGFLTLACLIAFSQWLTKKLEAREAKKEVRA